MPFIVSSPTAGPASIVDYATLQSAVAAWLHRDDLSGYIPDFISHAEFLMSTKLKTRAMETRTTLTCTAANAYVTLPTDVVEARRLYSTSTSPQRLLKYVTPDEMVRNYPWQNQGEPYVWTVIGPEIQLANIPDAAYTLELAYLQKIPALTNSNTTNWVLSNWPSIYLYGALAQGFLYILDDANAKKYLDLFNAMCDQVNGVDWYSGNTMQVRTA